MNKHVQLPNSVHHLPAGATAVRKTNPNQFIDLTVGVRRKKELPDLSGLDNRLPADREYMTRDQLTRDYGSDPKAVSAVQAFATKNGLVVTRDQPAAARLGLGGTVADLSRAFGVNVMDYTHPTLGKFHARTGPVSLPAEVAAAITGVFGFNNNRVLRRRRHGAAQLHADLACKSRAWFIPTELGAAYNFPDTGGLLDGHFAAGPGWDACSGWGTPDGQKLLAAFKPTT